MKEFARVLKVRGKFAVVQIEKTVRCEGCKVCAFQNGKSTVKLKALNTAGAKAGDRVVVQAEKDNRLLASFIVYILPLLFAGAGAAVGALAVGGELWAALLCLAGFAVGFFAVWLIDKRVSRLRGFGMEVVAVEQNKNREEEHSNG